MTAKMTLFQSEPAPCYPITLTEARKHLAVDASDRSNDTLIEMLIASASHDAEMKTGRVWVHSKWEWKLSEDYVLNEAIEFPTVPVSVVELYDLDEELEEGAEPTDLSSEYLSVTYPSPEPQGMPYIGYIIVLKTLPVNYKMILTAGYPVTTYESLVEKFDEPTLVLDATQYTPTSIHLVFERPVSGEVEPSNFTIRDADVELPISSVSFNEGALDIVFEEGVLTENMVLKMDFIEGTIADAFDNYVQPMFDVQLPTVSFIEDGEELNKPEPDEVKVDSYESHTPAPVKNWILTRVGSLYSQRTEIALRAGKSNDALFPDKFINNLLSPYKVRFA